jgi:hypothetical protein
MSNSTMASSGVNVAQAASESLVSGPLSIEADAIRMRPHLPKGGAPFSYLSVLAAAMVFIIVIGWFETFRIWIEYKIIPDDANSLKFRERTIAQMTYAALGTMIAIVIILLLRQLDNIV